MLVFASKLAISRHQMRRAYLTCVTYKYPQKCLSFPIIIIYYLSVFENYILTYGKTLEKKCLSFGHRSKVASTPRPLHFGHL